MKRTIISALAALAAVAAGPVAAQSFPEKPVRIVVSFPPGGPSDILARSLGDKLTAALKQPFVVENRAGAGGNVGTEAVARSAPDGYTVLFTIDTPFTVNPNLYRSIPFKPADLRALMLIASSGLTVGINPSVGSASLRDFVTKGRTETITFSSGSNGSPGHVAASILQDAAGVKVNHIPYKGNTPAVMAVVSGEVQAGILATPGLLPHVQAGKVKALAVTSRKRSPLLPDVPTTVEAGVPALEVEVLYLAFVPVATPERVAATLQQALAAALAAPDVQERMRRLDLVIEGETGAVVEARLAKARERYAATIKATGMKID
ncbi:MAG TPA: tripartite tricarboxylate transporter substrate binding protein [Burkholderiales bacterium]|nr:tripartite tricarboxylate transporter substrate binding protein [Burkholderiales bacterium]